MQSYAAKLLEDIYSSALYQIRALEKAFKKQNNGQSVPKILVFNACIDWPKTLKIYMRYSTYFAWHNDLYSAVLTNIIGDIFLSFLPYLSLTHVVISGSKTNSNFRRKTNLAGTSTVRVCNSASPRRTG